MRVSVENMVALQNLKIIIKRKIFLLQKIREYRKQLQFHGKNFPYQVMQYEKKWRYLKKKYGCINIYGIEFVGIGETVPRIFMFLRDKKEHKLPRGFQVVMPVFFKNYQGGIFNKGIFSVFGKHIYFIMDKNISFWTYIFLFHSDEINISQFERYKVREAVRFNINEKNKYPFDNKTVAYASDKMKRMGIKKEYICIHAREAITKKVNFDVYPDTSVCDVKLESFSKACNYMDSQGYQVIRMGKDEEKECKIHGVIDYANQFYDELMDFYLIANCKFLIGCSSGLTVITPYWGRPILLTNQNVFCWASEALPTTGKDLYIPKKFFSKKERRYLNLYEMLNVSHKCDRYTKAYRMERIELIDNTEEEILEATTELNEKLDNTWKETDDEKKCMKKYWEIMSLWKNRHQAFYTDGDRNAKGYEMLFLPICYSYLKRNRYLLEGEEIE